MTYRRLCTMASILALFLVGVTSAMAAAPPKTDVCHFQPENGTWKKISVGGSAPAAHLENHDDALPGGVTAQTGTQLNENCEALCGDCLSEHGPGCQVDSCQAAVCAVDPFCCESAWDSLCVSEAQDLCVVGDLCFGPNCGDCFDTGHGTGCQLDSCEAAVCAVDAFCCDVAWDGLCVSEAIAICPANNLCPLQ